MFFLELMMLGTGRETENIIQKNSAQLISHDTYVAQENPSYGEIFDIFYYKYSSSGLYKLS